MPTRKYTVGRYSPTNYPTDIGYLITPSVYTAASTKVIVNCHGRGSSGYQSCVAAILQPHVDALVAAGYAVLGVDHARVNSWGDPDAIRSLVDGIDTYLPSLGFSTTFIGMLGLSMGGETVLNYSKRYPSKVKAAWLFNPVTDLRFFRDGSGAYTPSYSISPATQAPSGWPAEIDTTFGPSTTANGIQTINGNAGARITLNIAAGGGKSFADGHNAGVTGNPQGTVNSATFDYTGKTDSTLTGVRATGISPIAVSNGAAITSAYATQSLGYRPYDEPAQWAGTGPKIKICQASDDATVAPGMNANNANGFVGKVNHADVTLRSPSPTGGHLNSLLAVPPDEVVRFFLANY